jgi:hypothetical protein
MQIREHRILSTGFVRNSLLLVSAAACLIAATAHANDTAARHADETRRDKAAVIAVDEHWSEAEMSGDTAWLDRMLLPEYRSVSADGTAHPKSAILASARKNLHSDKMRRKVEAWRKAHPSATSVVLRDNVAILSFYDPALGPQKGVTSSDIFVYIDGHWHALYSQHASVRTHKTP